MKITTEQEARALACLLMRRLTIYPGSLEDLTDEMNRPDPDIEVALADLILGFEVQA